MIAYGVPAGTTVMFTRIPVVLAMLVCLSACGSEAAKPAPSASPAPASPGASPAPAGDVATFTVEGNDQMQYSVKQMDVKAGQKVRITLKNVGSAPKAAMGHNLVVLRKGVTKAQFEPLVMAPKGTLENEYLPAEARKEVLAHTKLLGPGESDTIEFSAPGLPGELIYLCTFPAHSILMHGKIVVGPADAAKR